MKLRILISIFLLPSVAFSQASFSVINSEVCQNESLLIDNTTANGVSYIWDYYFDEVSVDPVQNSPISIAGASRTEGIEVVFTKGKWFGFITDRTTGIITRLDYGESLNSIPTEIKLGIIGSSGNGIRIIEESGNWYGIMASYNGRKIYRLSFGADIEAIPTVEDLGNLNGWDFLRGIDLVNFNDSIYVAVSSFTTNQVTLINFGTTIVNPPVWVRDLEHAGQIDWPAGLSFSVVDSKLYGLVSSYSNNKAFLVSFADDQLSVETFHELGTISKPTDTELIKTGNKIFGLALSESDGLYKLEFGPSIDIGSLPPIQTVPGLSLPTQTWNMRKVRNSPDWQLMILKREGPLYRIDFNDSTGGQTSFEPDIAFFQPGTYPIELTAFSSNGNFDTYMDTVVVRDATAPTISFNTQNACIENQNSFTASSSDDPSITTWNWDFGDGTGTASGQSVEYQYANTGVYQVSLDIVNNDGCTNLFSDSIRIAHAPIASFDLPINNLCTNTELNFSNNSNSLDEDQSIFIWNYNSEYLDTVLNGAYTFGSSGLKEITLIAELTGCRDTLIQQITLTDGPETSFSWTNNCFGDSVQFINESEISNTVFTWNFGDGSSPSNTYGPTHLFVNPGTFQLSLQVVDTVSRCISFKYDSIVVNGHPLVNYSVNQPITENISTRFTGIDQTTSKDLITNWQWTFEEYESITDQEFDFTFNSPDSINLQLSVLTEQGCNDTLYDTIIVQPAEKPIVQFSAQDSVCIIQKLDLTNNSFNAINFTWDYYFDEVSVDPVQNSPISIAGASRTEGIEVVFTKGKWYGFITDRTTGIITRLDYGESLNSIPTEIKLGIIGSSGNGIRIIEESGNWYGIMASYNGRKIYRLSFGADIEAIPTVEDLGNLNGWDFLRGIDLVNFNDSIYVAVSSFTTNQVTLINFGTTIVNPPVWVRDLEHAGQIDWPAGLSFSVVDSKLYGLVSSYSNNKAFLVSFADDQLSVETFHELGTISKPTDTELIKTGNKIFGLALSESDGLYKLEFGPSIDIGSLPPIQTVPGLSLPTQTWNMRKVRNSPDWQLMILKREGPLYRIDFNDSTGGQTSFEPDIAFFQPGTYPIELTAFSSNGNFDTYMDTVVVRDATAPTISFNTQNACIENQNSFTASSSDDPSITTWNWDFGDGTGTASGQSVEYQYANTGTFDVGLAIDAENGCSNSASKKIHIYNPPNPSFSYTSGVTCSNSPLDFVNSTAFSGPDSLLSFQWNMNDEMLLDDSAPSYIFKTGGEKYVTLTAYIPGCDNVASELIDITPGPETAFTFQGSCEQESFTFSNATTGNGITGYRWDFGDGYTSTVPSPIHRFESAGSFPVSLTASNELGCNTTLQQVVAAQFLPVPNFTNDLACSDKEVTFYDQSSVSNANIIDSQWRLSNSSIGYSQQASGPSPTFQAEAEGQYRLRLIVESNYGCVDTLIRDDVTVNPSPTADFVFSNTCFGDETLFSEAAMLPPDTDINTVDWLINDNLFTANEVTYQFLTPGSYPVEMFVRASNFCTDNTSKTIDINPLPTLDILVTDSCESYPVSINATVDSPLDPVESYAWMIDEKLISSLDGFSYVFDSPGIYEIALAVATRNNCTNSSTKTINIHPIPNSGFEVFPSIGASPLNVAFTDRSSGAKSVIYDFSIYNDDVSADDNTRYIYTDVRKDWPQQIAFNDFGCTDTSFVEIEAVIPIYDIAMARATTETGGAGLQMSFELINNGTIIINNPVVKIDLGDNASLNHPLTGRIMPGENRRFDVDFEVLNANKGIRYICFEAPTVLGSYEDVNPYDNANCVSIEQSFSVFDPYPNPSQGQFFLPIVLPETASCELSVFGEKGELVWQRNFQNAKKGLNLFQINASNYGQGVFLLNIRYEGIETTKKILLR